MRSLLLLLLLVLSTGCLSVSIYDPSTGRQIARYTRWGDQSLKVTIPLSDGRQFELTQSAKADALTNLTEVVKNLSAKALP